MVFKPVEKFSDPRPFTMETVRRIREAAGDQKVYIAVSGGVDSSAVAAMIYDAIGNRMIAEHYDHGGMRKGEPQQVVKELGRAFPVMLYDARELFMEAVKAVGEDSEAKRKDAISPKYFLTMLERARAHGCRLVADGTIEPDWRETVDMGLKWQHNIPSDNIRRMYEEAGIQFLHPLFYQAKPQSRFIAELYGLPMKRRPFPGPGLYVRAIGQITEEKMEVVREADSIVTPVLGEMMEARDNGLDKQYFCAVVESWRHPFNVKGDFGVRIEDADIYRAKVTGMSENNRVYRNLLAIESWDEITNLVGQANNIVRANSERGVGRIVLKIDDRKEGKYTALLRAIETPDFRTARAVPLPMDRLRSISYELLKKIPELDCVAFDIQDKPDSTIEFE